MNEERLDYARRKVDYMVKEGIVTTFQEQDRSGNAFDKLQRSSQPKSAQVHATIYAYLIGALLMTLQWSAQLFHAILHHKHGRRYMHPIRFIVSAFSSLLLLGGVFASFAGALGGGGLLSSGVQAGAAVLGLAALGPIFLVGLIVVAIQYSIAVSSFDDEPRHTQSIGIPWLYTRMGNDLFITTRYTFIYQPLAVLAATFVLAVIFKGLMVLPFLAAIFFVLHSLCAASVVHDHHLDNIDARIDIEYRAAEDVLFQAEIEQIKQQPATADTGSNLLSNDGQPEIVKPKGAKSYV